MSIVWQHMRFFLRQDHYVASWRARLSDPSTAASLREQDKNVAQLQSILQEFSATGRKTFRAVVVFLLTKICVFEDDILLFTYIRAILEVFVLYSIVTSDFAWIDDSRAVCIECQIETMSKIMSSPIQDPCPEAVVSEESFPRMAALIEKMSRREHSRAKIITTISDLTNEMIFLDSLFMTYEHGRLSHEHNNIVFLKRLEPSLYRWIAMAYSLAIEPVVYEPPPRYPDDPPEYTAQCT